MMNEQLKLSNQLCHRFYTASNAITRAYKPFLQQLDVTYPQYLVLLALWQQDQLEVGQVRAMTKIDPGALSLIVKKLVEKNYIEVQQNQDDKRVKQLFLTAKGQQAELIAQDIPVQLRCQFADVSKQELQQLMLLLDKVNASLTSNG